MLLKNMNFFQVEEYLQKDDRVLFPLGSCEQHAYLSVCTDYILSTKLAEDVAQQQKVVAYPGLPFGMTPYNTAYPGTINIAPTTYFYLIKDILDSLYASGFRRILFVNGHGGNSAAKIGMQNWLMEKPDARIILHDWWKAPLVAEKVMATASVASHASWMENFPWSRVAGVAVPQDEKPMQNLDKLAQLPPDCVRNTIGDGNYGGYYQMDDTVMEDIWRTAIAETSELLANGWAV